MKDKFFEHVKMNVGKFKLKKKIKTKICSHLNMQRDLLLYSESTYIAGDIHNMNFVRVPGHGPNGPP